MDQTAILARNLTRVREQMAEAAARAGRDPGAVRLVAITKTATVEQTRALYDLGVRDFGENRLEAARPKIAALPKDAVWHWIAPVQRRKAREIVGLFQTVDAIDRIEAAEALQQRCEAAEKRLRVLVEVNVSGEESKHGFTPAVLPEVLQQLQTLDRLHLEGLMTMAPFEAEQAEIRGYFRSLRELAKNHELPETSMGMSSDFVTAIEEGATQVRIGSILFQS